jgi:hypothetical protein
MQTQTNEVQNTGPKSKKSKKAKQAKQEVVVVAKQNDQAPAEQEPTPAEQAKPKKKGLAATMAKYRGGYEDGKSCGDAIAARLAGMSLAQVLAEAEQVSGLEPGALVAKYASLNNGQQRMTAGNRIRAAAKKAQKAIDAEIAAFLASETK